MKKLLTILFIISAIYASGQPTYYMNVYRVQDTSELKKYGGPLLSPNGQADLMVVNFPVFGLWKRSPFATVDGVNVLQGAAGRKWEKLPIGIDSVKRIPGIDSTFYRIAGNWIATKDSVASASGQDNTNTGTGYRLVVLSSQAVKSLIPGNGVTMDSTSTAGTLTIKLDTSVAATKAYALYLYNILDAKKITLNNDATTVAMSSGTYSLTLATVNSNVGTFGNATNVPQITVNAKGLTTAISNVPITFPTETDALSWHLAGNAATAGSQTGSFLGTTNNVSIRLRANNIERAVFDSTGQVKIITQPSTPAGDFRLLTWQSDGYLGSVVSTTYLKANQTITYVPTGDVTGMATGTTTLAPNLLIGLNKVKDTMLRQSAGLSLIGRSANTTGNVADITAGSDYQVMRRSGSTIGFGQVATGGVEDAAITYAKIQNITGSRLTGRYSASAGPMQEVSIGTGLALNTITGELTATGSAPTDTHFFANSLTGTASVTHNANGYSQNVINSALFKIKAGTGTNTGMMWTSDTATGIWAGTYTIVNTSLIARQDGIFIYGTPQNDTVSNVLVRNRTTWEIEERSITSILAGAYTVTNLGGQLDNYDSQVGNNFRFNTFAASDFDLGVDGANIISLDATKKSEWNTAYNKRPTAVAFTGTTLKTLTLTHGDGSTSTATFTDIDTDTDTDTQGKFGYPTEDVTAGEMRDFDLGTAYTLTLHASGFNNPFYVESYKAPAIFGYSTSTSIGVAGGSVSGTGVDATSSYAIALKADSDNDNPAAEFQNGGGYGTSTNTVITTLKLVRQSPVAGYVGIGSAIDYYIDADNGSDFVSNRLISKWAGVSSAPSFRTSQFEIHGVDNAVTGRKLALGGTGSLTLDKYGDGLFTGTATYNLAVDVDGNVIEVSAGGSPYSFTLTGGGGSASTVEAGETVDISGTGATNVSKSGNNYTIYSSLNLSDYNNDVPFLTSESDPVFSASAAAGITGTDISNWNAAETDPNSVHLTGTQTVGGLKYFTDGFILQNLALGFQSTLGGTWNMNVIPISITSNHTMYLPDASGYIAYSGGTLGTGQVYSLSGELTNTNPSDRRLKNSITPYTAGLKEINQLNPKTFYYNSDKEKKSKKYGYIAQDVQKIFPDAVRKLSDKNDYLGLEDMAITVALVNAVKELSAKVDAQQKIIDQLKNKK